MGQDWIAFIKEVEPVFLINPVNLVPEVRCFQTRVRDLRAERDEVTAATRVPSFARCKSVVANNAAEAVRCDHVGLKRGDRID